ncbi:radical SAM protein [Candidatus Bipolaricaulota bacterium]|nr:radical SAM protein [Candidatus Bipolaricaulota bacterium]
MSNISVPEPKSVGLILSYRCTAECTHCMFACGPEWEEDLISYERLEGTLAELSKYIVPGPNGPDSIGLNHGLHLTGGEPFLHYDKLLEATKLADDIGIPSIFVETNSFWCGDEETTVAKLQELRRAGLNGIMISVNPFYLEYVPFENTRRAVNAGREIFGQDAIVYQSEYLREFERMGVEGTLDLNDYIDRQGGDLERNVEFFLSGRAPYVVPEYDISGLTARSPEWWFDRPCRPPFLREWHNHVDNYGNYIPGYCGGLTFGRIENMDGMLSEGIDRDDFPILSLLVEDDFDGLYDLSREYGYREAVPGYYSKCHLCLDLRRHLYDRGNFAELKPDEFYRQLPDG